MSRVEGIEAALEDLNLAIEEVKDKSQRGFTEVALRIINKSQKILQGSVVTGNLRASGYVRTPVRLFRPDSQKMLADQNEAVPADSVGTIGAEVGFTAVYGLNVHENLQGSRTPKFLERPLLENKDRIVDILKATAGAE